MRKSLIAMIFLVLIMGTGLFASVKVGEIVTQTFETQHPYNAVKGLVWEKEFYYANAGYIAVHFTQVDLAKGDYIEISSPDGKFIYTFRDKGKDVKDKKGNKSQISTFWATHIPGDKAVVRLINKSNKSGYGFVIDKWARGYEKGFIDATMSDLEDDELAAIEAVCTNDDKQWAKCYDGTTMYNKSKAVCRLLINGNTACTGWLMGSAGHVMTNNHCIETQTEANNTDFEFMAEGATCGTSCASWGACPGTVAASAGTLIKANVDLDYSLVLLPTNVSGTYGYLQLRNALPTIGERIYIPQHPGCYGKQLAVNSDVDGPYAKIYGTSQPPCTGGPGDIGYYADTAGGSSGSPVIAYTDNLVVSLHHCGTCPNRGVPVPAIITDLGSSLPADSVGGGGSVPVTYCSAYSKNQNHEWIARVQISNLDNSTGASAYSDFTNKKANLTKGSNAAVTLTPGFSNRSYTEYWKVWIDYNVDGDFTDTGEEVFSGSGSSAVTGNFTVSSSATIGDTRIRVIMRYGSAPTSCGSFTYGEVEDYTATIQ